MAIVNMELAQPNTVAKSAEYNNVVNNVLDLDARIGTAFTDVDNVSTWASSAQSSIDTLNSRTTDASTGNTALGSRVSSLEGVKRTALYYGEWADDAVPGSGDTSSTAAGNKVTVFTNPVGTPTGMSMNNGTITVANAGLYLVSATVQVGANNGSVFALFAGKSANASASGVTMIGPTSGYRADVLTFTGAVRMNANDPISVYMANWQNTPAVTTYQVGNCKFSVTYLGA